MKKIKGAKIKFSGPSIADQMLVIDDVLFKLSLIYGAQTSLDILSAFTKSYKAILKNEKQMQRKFYQKHTF